MPNKKSPTNVTFRKRVDHQAGRTLGPRVPGEPQVCRECRSVYLNRRWRALEVTSGKEKPEFWQAVQITICPACKQQHTHIPQGFVYVYGDFFATHCDEIEQLLRNEAARAADDNPLARIMEWERSDIDTLALATTTELLAKRLGRALEKAFSGKVHYDFSHENKLARVRWHRD
jgi:hypothetical protein